ncbi:MAG: DMT family transporter [Candidatus Dependentiae bacterium]|jgi:drug/metabolite transporter (DMT)-like permease
MLLIALEYAILASTFTIAKKALSYSTPFFLIATRMLVAGFLLLATAVFLGRVSWRKVCSDWFLFLQAALFHCYLAFIPEFWALQHLSSAKTSIMYAVTPFVAALLAYALRGQRLSGRKWSAMAIGVAGLVPIIWMQLQPGEVSALGQVSWPELVLLGAVTSACYAWFVVTDLMKLGHSLLTINGIAMGVGGLLSVPTFLFAEGPAWLQVTDWHSFVGWLSLLILLAHGISYNLYGLLLTRYSIPFMTFCGFLCPLFSTVFGAYFLGEAITWHHGASLVIITAGLTLFARADGLKIAK